MDVYHVEHPYTSVSILSCQSRLLPAMFSISCAHDRVPSALIHMQGAVDSQPLSIYLPVLIFPTQSWTDKYLSHSRVPKGHGRWLV